MTLGSILTAYLATIDLGELTDDARGLLDGVTDEEAVVIVAHLLDAAIPEELFGDKADTAAEPLYAEAAARIVGLVLRRTGRKGVGPHRVKRLMDGERARVDALLAAGGAA